MYYVGKRQTKKEIYGLASHCIDNPLAQLLAQIICSKPIIYIVYTRKYSLTYELGQWLDYVYLYKGIFKVIPI